MTMMFQSQRPLLIWPLFRPLVVEALPWLLLATTARWVASIGGSATFPAILVASFAVLHAFYVMVRHSIERDAGQTDLGEPSIPRQLKLSLSVTWRTVLLLIAMTLVISMAGDKSLSHYLAFGIDGLAYDQDSDLGKFWSAAVAALVLLMIVEAGRSGARVKFFASVRELARQWRWVVVAVIGLGLVYVGLGYVQSIARGMVWDFQHDSSSGEAFKRLVKFLYTFGFAMLRLSVTVLILTCGLKWFSSRAAQGAGVSSARP
jgi:hypothetical protein